jgi:hypothetical protein
MGQKQKAPPVTRAKRKQVENEVANTKNKNRRQSNKKNHNL